MTNLTFKQFEAVHQVARSGTVVKAAESLHVTPAALTSRIKLSSLPGQRVSPRRACKYSCPMRRAKRDYAHR